MTFDSRPNPSVSPKERREERLEAKSRGLTVEEWEKRKAKNQEKFRYEQKEKLDISPLELSFRNDLSVKTPVELAAWDGNFTNLLSFLKAAYEKGGENNPDELNRKASVVQQFIMDMIGDHSLTMTSSAVLRLKGNQLLLAGVHSNKFGKRVEEIVRDRKLDAEMDAAQSATHEAGTHSGAVDTIIGDRNGIHLGGTLPPYNPADDGLTQTQREDRPWWVSDGTKPERSGPSTISPAKL